MGHLFAPNIDVTQVVGDLLTLHDQQIFVRITGLYGVVVVVGDNGVVEPCLLARFYQLTGGQLAIAVAGVQVGVAFEPNAVFHNVHSCMRF